MTKEMPGERLMADARNTVGRVELIPSKQSLTFLFRR